MTSNEIMKVMCSNNKFVYIDFSHINKENFRGARVFKILFKLEDSPFKTIEMEKDEEGNIILFKNLDIERHKWLLFYSFLKHGKILSDSSSRSWFKTQLDKAMTVSNKLGGFPEYDKYYMEEVSKNPKTPYEDIDAIYKWSGYLITTHRQPEINWMNSYNINEWSLINIEKRKEGDFYWYRK
tara:strand:- start:8 stop:553 length:546 start_codon:yes stop_codon:yes gene_type:complete